MGGTGSGNDLTVSSTTNSAKGKILFGTSAYDEANNWLGLGYTTPTNTLHVGGTGLRVDGWFAEGTTNKGVYLGINPFDSTPRVMFANGNAAESWQIDNKNGNFRWYLPGVTHMTLKETSLTLHNKILSVTGTGNNYFAGKVGVGLSTPTALIHLKSGTASAGTSPLKFTAGVNLSIPEDGAIEYDGTHFYGTVGAVRHQLDQQGTSLPIAITSSTNSSYTLNISDAGKLITQNNGSPNIITVPANSSVAFPIGTEIILNQYGTGQTLISKVTGVVINSLSGALRLKGQYATATLTKVSTDTWILNGDITNDINTTSIYDQDAQKFFDSSGISDSTIKAALNNFVIQLKDSSLWTKFEAIYPMLGGTASSTKWNLKNPVNSNAAYRLTFNGNPTFSNTGVLFPTNSDYANTHFADSQFNYNNNSISYYSRTQNTISGYDMGCQDHIAPYNAMAIYHSSNASDYFGYYRYGYKPASTVGLFMISATASNNVWYENGIAKNSKNSAPLNAYTRTPILIGWSYGAGSGGRRECALATIGKGLTAAEALTFANIVLNFQNATGR